MHLFQFTIKLVEFRSPRSKFNELISDLKSSFVTEDRRPENFSDRREAIISPNRRKFD